MKFPLLNIAPLQFDRVIFGVCAPARVVGAVSVIIAGRCIALQPARSADLGILRKTVRGFDRFTHTHARALPCVRTFAGVAPLHPRSRFVHKKFADNGVATFTKHIYTRHNSPQCSRAQQYRSQTNPCTASTIPANSFSVHSVSLCHRPPPHHLLHTISPPLVITSISLLSPYPRQPTRRPHTRAALATLAQTTSEQRVNALDISCITARPLSQFSHCVHSTNKPPSFSPDLFVCFCFVFEL